MPHYHNDSEVIKNLFGDRLAQERGEQESRQRAQLESRIDALKSQLTQSAVDSQVYIDLANGYAVLDDYAATLDTLRTAAARFPLDGEVHYALIRRLQKYGLDEEALAAGERACRLVPDDFALRLNYHLYLPKLYDSEPEIHRWHRRYTQGLEQCIAACDLETREGALRAAGGFSRYANFFLAYQGFDDIPLLRCYGEFVHRVMAAAYPHWSQLPAVPPARSEPRVGFVSAFFRSHTVGQHFLGWLTERDRTVYRAHCYYLGDVQDSITEEYRRASDSFFQNRDLETMCAAIQRDQPDVLVFTDVGMDPIVSQIAALRLAPVQCVAYGHPVTTGLPTMDYFISGELMEPPDPQQFYTEKLVTLPNLGICYAKPIIPRAFLTKTRSDFGLPADAVVYLSCQSLFKYLPQYDHLFAEIALAVPNARFVFLGPNELRRRAFLRRLERAFSAAGLRAADFCCVLPEQSSFDYWNLHLVADVFLDTIGWSAGRSALDAVGCGLPIVTLPGRIMRQRQASATLSLLGVGETIARNETDYTKIAVRAGKERQWGKETVSKIESGHRCFSQRSTLRALENLVCGFVPNADEAIGSLWKIGDPVHD